jgi:hypothetical protein
MPAFRAADGTELAYRVQGEGIPLVCLPGGPMRDSVYLGDLGGLSAWLRQTPGSSRAATLALRPPAAAWAVCALPVPAETTLLRLARCPRAHTGRFLGVSRMRHHTLQYQGGGTEDRHGC